jgi:hypothetical protein
MKVVQKPSLDQKSNKTIDGVQHLFIFAGFSCDYNEKLGSAGGQFLLSNSFDDFT